MPSIARIGSASEVVAWLNGQQAVVVYDYAFDFDARRWTASKFERYPNWLRNLVGDDFLHDVVAVEWEVLERPLNNEDLTRICRLTGLRRLYVGAVIGSDAVFAHVLKPAINDNQLVQLRALPNLEALAIGNAESITDAGLAAFSRQADIRQLRLYDAVQITDAGFAALASLYRLESLSVTDASGVTDGGLRAVARLPTLRSLALNGSKITDQGVQCLHSATQIESVDFCRTQVSQAGLRKLRDALPSCKISPYVYPDVARKPAGTKWPSQSAVQPAGADGWRLGPAGNSHAIPSLAPNGPRTEE